MLPSFASVFGLDLNALDSVVSFIESNSFSILVGFPSQKTYLTLQAKLSLMPMPKVKFVTYALMEVT